MRSRVIGIGDCIMTHFDTRNGMLYIVEEIAQWDVPFLSQLYYPTGLPIHYCPDAPGSEAKESSDGTYISLTDPRLIVTLPDGGATKPELTEQRPIPAPKRCKESKYQRGAWYKLTVKGWVIV